MIITRIELTNWGPHVSLKKDTGCNVLGVIGANGKGKSNLLQAIDFGLNGNLNKQNKELYIHDFGKEGGATKASVYLEFEKNGKKGSIFREITKTTTKRLLKWEGKEYKSDAEVSAQMEKILGADKAAMANAIFCKQGELAKLVKGTPAVRQEIFQKLMNLSFLNIREVNLKNKIDRLKSGVTDYQPIIDATVVDISNKKEEIKQTEETLAQHTDHSEDIRNIQSYLSLLSRADDAFTRWQTQRSRMLDASASLTDAKKFYGDLEALKENVAKYSDRIAELTAGIDSWKTSRNLSTRLAQIELSIKRDKEDLKNCEYATQEEIDKASEDAKSADSLYHSVQRLSELRNSEKSLKEQRDKLSNELEQCRKTLEQMVADENERQEKIKPVVELATQTISVLKCKVSYLSSDLDTDVCPVCGNSMHKHSEEERDKELNDANEKINKLRNKLDELDSLQKSIESKLNSTERVIDSLVSRISNIESALKQTSEDIQIILGKDEWIQDLSLDAAIDMQTECHNKLTHVINDNKKMSVLTTSIERLEKEKETIDLSVIDNCPDNVEDLEKELNETRDLLSSTQSNIDKLVKAESDLNATSEAAKDSEYIMRDLCAKRDEAFEKCPEIVTSNKMNSTEDEISFCNGILMAFDEDTKSYSSSSGILNTLNAQLSSKQSDLARLRDNQDKEKDRLELINDLMTVKRIVSSSGLPLAYMNAVFNKVTVMVQDMLSQMGANFTVFPDKEKPLTFKFVRVDTGDNYEMPQELLSGGQAIRLSLALLIACQQLILPEVGLLVLDEPSSHLDADGIDSLCELFQKMTSIFNNSNTQLIVVDHAVTMESAFEKFIQL